MSSKKISKTIGLDEKILLKLDAEAEREIRSRSSMLEKILADRYQLTINAEGESNAHAA